MRVCAGRHLGQQCKAPQGGKIQRHTHNPWVWRFAQQGGLFWGHVFESKLWLVDGVHLCTRCRARKQMASYNFKKPNPKQLGLIGGNDG